MIFLNSYTAPKGLSQSLRQFCKRIISCIKETGSQTVILRLVSLFLLRYHIRIYVVDIYIYIFVSVIVTDDTILNYTDCHLSAVRPFLCFSYLKTYSI